MTPYPQGSKLDKTYLKKEQVKLQWAKQMWEFARTQQNWSARFDELQGQLQQGAIDRTYLQSQLEWVLYRLEQLNPEFIARTLLRLEEKIGAIPDKTPALSEVGMDYRQLTKLLETGKWRKADEHTWDILLQIALREDEGWLSPPDIDNLPCTDLRTIDQLWQHHSSGRFGLSVQQQIWESAGSEYTESPALHIFIMIFKNREWHNKGTVVQSSKMQCPKCNGEEVVKNGHRYGKQCYRCKQCNRQFVETYSERGYSEDAKQICSCDVL